jgi:hypothetical protein
LLGRLVERIESRGDSVPVWAWTNLLAHGTDGDLGAESGTEWPGWDAAEKEWRQVRSYLATEVLHSAKLHGPLAEVQRVVLVPLELELASNAEVAEWKPGQWAITVETALTHQHQVGKRG